jgi:hypothetical protein
MSLSEAKNEVEADGEGGKSDEDGRSVDGGEESGVAGGAIAEKFGRRRRGRVWSGQLGVYSAYKYERSRAGLRTGNWSRCLTEDDRSRLLVGLAAKLAAEGLRAGPPPTEAISVCSRSTTQSCPDQMHIRQHSSDIQGFASFLADLTYMGRN